MMVMKIMMGPPTLTNELSLIQSIVVLFYLIQSSLACSCVYSHPQEHFCSADFVAQVTVRGSPKTLRTFQYQSYPIKVHRIFKGSHKSVLQKGFLFTGSSLSSCSQTFNTNVLYLVTGRIINGKPFVSGCNFVQEWVNLTHWQRKGFRKNYGRSCRCKVRDFHSYVYYTGNRSMESNESPPSLSSNQARVNAKSSYCHWETKWEIENDCEGFYSACVPLLPSREIEFNDVMPGSRGERASSRYATKNEVKCHWEENTEYRRCMKRRNGRKLSQLERQDEP